jgi:hypothetical protein
VPIKIPEATILYKWISTQYPCLLGSRQGQEQKESTFLKENKNCFTYYCYIVQLHFQILTRQSNTNVHCAALHADNKKTKSKNMLSFPCSSSSSSCTHIYIPLF